MKVVINTDRHSTYAVFSVYLGRAVSLIWRKNVIFFSLFSTLLNVIGWEVFFPHG